MTLFKRNSALVDSAVLKAAASVLTVTLLTLSAVATVAALPGPRSYTDEDTGDVFLGGDYIELGISQLGSFGTSEEGGIPEGFFGAGDHNGIGMSTNSAGFDEEPDLRMDFFMPGSPEERWSVGYTETDIPHFGSNSLLNGPSEDPDEGEVDTSGEDIADNVVTDQSNGDTLQAESVGTFNDVLETTQVISFQRDDKVFRNEVTLKNVGENSIDSVRYMRSFDPDNTVDQDGEYETRNFIPFTHEGGDGKAVVFADTSWDNEDPVYLETNSRSPIFFYSDDARARVSTFGFANGNPYYPLAYDEALPKGTSIVEDQAISIAFDVGTLDPDESQTFVYYTSLDDRGLAALQELEGETAGANNDKNGDGIIDSYQSEVKVITSSVTGKIVILESSGCEVDTALMEAEIANAVQDPGYHYPQGLMNFNVDCGEPGYTTTITKYYYDVLPADSVLRKYNPTSNAYFTIEDGIISTQTIYGQTVTTVSYPITDNGDLDISDTDGVIVDPAGLANQALSAPNTGLGFLLGLKK